MGLLLCAAYPCKQIMIALISPVGQYDLIEIRRVGGKEKREGNFSSAD